MSEETKHEKMAEEQRQKRAEPRPMFRHPHLHKHINDHLGALTQRTDVPAGWQRTAYYAAMAGACGGAKPPVPEEMTDQNGRPSPEARERYTQVIDEAFAHGAAFDPTLPVPPTPAPKKTKQK